MQVLDLAEARRLCSAAAEDTENGVLPILAVTTGMRQGELLALRWRDVDLERGTLAVTGTLQRVPNKGLTRDEPKTLRSRRQVRLPPTAVTALRRQQAAQAAARLVAGDRWNDGDWVFASPFGAPLNAWAVRRHFAALLKQAELPPIRFHDLRHTAATLLLGQGVHPKVVADLLGHTTVAMTLDRYSHVAVAMHQQAADALEAALGDPVPSRVGSVVGSPTG